MSLKYELLIVFSPFYDVIGLLNLTRATNSRYLAIFYIIGILIADSMHCNQRSINLTFINISTISIIIFI
jgi:hypothetical protein